LIWSKPDHEDCWYEPDALFEWAHDMEPSRRPSPLEPEVLTT
jgi:hypothetical protein